MTLHNANSEEYEKECSAHLGPMPVFNDKAWFLKQVDSSWDFGSGIFAFVW